jgi:hypothetical protein
MGKSRRRGGAQSQSQNLTTAANQNPRAVNTANPSTPPGSDAALTAAANRVEKAKEGLQKAQTELTDSEKELAKLKPQGIFGLGFLGMGGSRKRRKSIRRKKRFV